MFVKIPPMTTVASGRCTSLPAEVETAILQGSPGNEIHLHAPRTELTSTDGRRAACIRDAGDWDALSETDREHLRGVFDERVFPVLTPLAVDPAHPFPYISNLSLNLAVIVADPHTGQRRFARVKVPPLLP